jgi:hypothetical protein
VPFLLAEQRRGWSLMIVCARATRGLGRVRRAAWPSSCSRNAHDKKDGKDTHIGPVLPERAP